MMMDLVKNSVLSPSVQTLLTQNMTAPRGPRVLFGTTANHNIDPNDAIFAPQLAALKASKETLTFPEYVSKVRENPTRLLRNPAQFAVDAMDYYDNKAAKRTRRKYLGMEVPDFSFVNKPWQPAEIMLKGGIWGQREALFRLYQHFKAEANKTHATRMITIHGPNGNGKTNLVETMFETFENYSTTPEGALYRTAWVFPEEDMGPKIMKLAGLGPSDAVVEREELAGGGEQAVITIPANLNSDPISLLPERGRVELLKELSRTGKIPPTFNSDYVLQSKMDSMSQKIFDALYKLYLGRTKDPAKALQKVYSHVRVERFNYSRLTESGLVIIPAAQSSDANIVNITPKLPWGRVSKGIAQAMSAAGLSQIIGPLAQANRGHIGYDDFMKDGDKSTLLSMLRWVEKGKLTPQAGQASSSGDNINLVAWATTNDNNVQAMMSDSEWPSFRERLKLIPVGYERSYRELIRILEEDFKKKLMLNPGRKVDPNVIPLLAMFITMSTLLPIDGEAFTDHLKQKRGSFHKEDSEKTPSDIAFEKEMDRLKDAMIMFDGRETVTKAMLYADDPLNQFTTRLPVSEEYEDDKPRFTSEQEMLLRKYVREMVDYYNTGNVVNKVLFYEGQFGISIREAYSLIDQLIQQDPERPITVLSLMEMLSAREQMGFDYVDQRSASLDRAQKIAKELDIPMPPEELIASPGDNIMQLEEYSARQIRYLFLEAAGLINPPDQELGTFYRYYQHLVALKKNQPVVESEREPQMSLNPNMDMMTSVEKALGLSGNDAIEKFRSEVERKLGSWSVNNGRAASKEDFADIFADEIQKLTEKNLQESHKQLRRLLHDIKDSYDGRPLQASAATKERVNLMNRTIKGLKDRGYSDASIPEILYFAYADVLQNNIE